jgi:thiamine kinase-like enzyme
MDREPAQPLESVDAVPDVLGRLQVLAGRAYSAAELGGGLTNRNYRVTTTDAGPAGDYVVRISANESGLLAIDRAHERYNTRMAWQAGVGAPVVESLPDENVLVVGFLSGRTLAATDIRDPALIPRVAAAVRMLHAGPEFQGSFDMRAIRRGYLEIVRSHGFRLPVDYLDLAARVEALEEAMVAGEEALVPCNNDLLAANFIDDGERIWLIDYEYSGMNEASFELGNIASESGLDLDATEALVSAYWGRPSVAKLARARAWSLLARYGWTLWASIQDAVSPIDFDFWSWGMEKYDSARAELLGSLYRDIVDGLGAGESGAGEPGEG